MNSMFNNFDIWFVLLVLCVVLLGSLVASAGVFRNLFMGVRTHTTWISSLPSQGWVEVLGKIRGDPIKSPFRKTECAYWQIEVQEYQNQGRGGGRWRTIHRSSSGSFMLDDMTGRIQVLDAKASMVTNNQSISDKSDPDSASFIESLGIKTTGFFGISKRQRLYERLILVDEEILVLGKLLKSSMPVTITGNDLVPVVISNQTREETNKALLGQTVKPLLIPLIIGAGVLVFFILSSTS